MGLVVVGDAAQTTSSMNYLNQCARAHSNAAHISGKTAIRKLELCHNHSARHTPKTYMHKFIYTLHANTHGF